MAVFFSEHLFILRFLLFLLLMVVTLSFLFSKLRTSFIFFQKCVLFWQICFRFIGMRVSGSRHVYILLLVSLDLLYYYWIGKVFLTTSGYFKNWFKTCFCKKKMRLLVEYFFFASILWKYLQFFKRIIIQTWLKLQERHFVKLDV